MKLVNSKGVGHKQVTSTPVIAAVLLVDILNHNLNQLLLQEIKFACVLKEKAEEFALGIELLEGISVNQRLQGLLKIVRKKLLKFDLRVEESRLFQLLLKNEVYSIMLGISHERIKLVLQAAHEE